LKNHHEHTDFKSSFGVDINVIYYSCYKTMKAKFIGHKNSGRT